MWYDDSGTNDGKEDTMTVITSIRVRRPERRHSPPRHLRRLPLTADQIADRDDDYMSIAAYWRQRR